MTKTVLDVVVVGGSIGGVSCALALLKQGCKVIVLEKASSITAAGAVSPAVSKLERALNRLDNLQHWRMVPGDWPR